MAARKVKSTDMMANLPGKQILVKYAEGDFHGTIVRRVGTNKYIIMWEGDTSEDSNPLTLDPRKCGKQFKADQNGWEIVGAGKPVTFLLSIVAGEDSEEPSAPAPAPRKSTTNSVKGVKVLGSDYSDAPR